MKFEIRQNQSILLEVRIGTVDWGGDVPGGSDMKYKGDF